MSLKSKIQDIKIYGDFFGIEDVAAVEEVLRGVKYEREDVLKALQTINLGSFTSQESLQKKLLRQWWNKVKRDSQKRISFLKLVSHRNYWFY